MSWCTECLNSFLLLCFSCLFFFSFLIAVKEFVKCRSWPEPDDDMSISAMNGTEDCIVFSNFKLTLI